MNCNNCGSSEIYTDSARGTVYCGECGMVQEENTIVSTLQFDNTSEKPAMHGQVVSVENTNIGTNYVDSSFYIKNTISSICIKMSLGDHHADSSFRWYKLCLQHSLSKGKLLLYTLSACVYITCRQGSTPHLLIDFSNALRIDMFKIGRLFLKLRTIFGIDIPLMDPSLYMHRFVSHLKFENRGILDYSVRLVDRMKKDWILTGRRPNNTCGAALLIASRIFNEEKNIDEIARAVHASPTTISKRLREMAETQSADLNIDEFRTNWLESEANPPIAKKQSGIVPSKRNGAVSKRQNRIASKKQSGVVERIGKAKCGASRGRRVVQSSSDLESDLIADSDDKENGYNGKTRSGAGRGGKMQNLRKERISRKGACMDEEDVISMCVQSIPKELIDEANDIVKECISEESEEYEYDDFDVDELILTKEEAEWKRIVWEEMYKDYEVEAAKKRENRAVRPAKAKRTTKRYNFETMEDAYRALDKKVSSKLNYGVIRDLFEFNLV